MNIKASIANHPRKWDYGFMLALTIALITSVSYIIGSEVRGHNTSVTAHPTMTTQMNRVEANQIKAQAMAMDALLCDDPNNSFYRSELSRLITEWETLIGENFPRELLRCAK